MNFKTILRWVKRVGTLSLEALPGVPMIGDAVAGPGKKLVEDNDHCVELKRKARDLSVKASKLGKDAKEKHEDRIGKEDLQTIIELTEKIELTLKPFLNQNGIKRWFNMKEMEKVVGQAEKDLEMARLRLEGAIAADTNDGMRFIVRELINVRMEQAKQKSRTEEIESAAEQALIFLNDRIKEMKEDFDKKLLELRDCQQTLTLLLFAVFVVAVVQASMLYYKL